MGEPERTISLRALREYAAILGLCPLESRDSPPDATTNAKKPPGLPRGLSHCDVRRRIISVATGFALSNTAAAKISVAIARA